MKIPDKVLSQHIAILGRTGSGKTYTAKGLVERLISEGRRVCVLDPTDAWWGLRSGPDGTSSGLPVVIFGGDHADVPITEHAGTAMGELIANSDFPSIISLANTTLGERHRFVERFAESLFRVNKRPLYLVIDEADEFAPQSGPPGTERMLGAIDRIVRRGRIKGFRVMMITQRPAVLNKNVLTQANTLIAMRLPSSQDRAAVEAWVKGQADESQAKDMMKSLASLQRGEGWLWAPEQNVLERVKFPAIATFDSSRTPDDGEPVRDVHVMRAVDVAGITKAMAAAIAKAKEDDPDELRKQIRDLRKQLTDERLKPIDVHAGEVGKLQDEIATLREQLRDSENRLIATESAMSRVADSIATIREGVFSATGTIVTHRETFPTRTNSDSPREASESRATQAPERPPTKALNASPVPAVAPAPQQDRPARGTGIGGKDRGLEKGVAAIVDAIAWWSAMGIDTPTREQVAGFAGYSVNGGGFNNSISKACVAGLVQREGGQLYLTPNGKAQARWPSGRPTVNELQERAAGILEAGPKKILLDLLWRGGRPVSRDEVADRCGYEPSGGGFNNYISKLHTLKLIVKHKHSQISAAPWLFGRVGEAA